MRTEYQIDSLESYQDAIEVSRGSEFLYYRENKLVFRDFDIIISDEYKSRIEFELRNREKKYQVIKDTNQLAALINALDTVDYVAYDTETTGVLHVRDKVIGIGVSYKFGEGYYLPLWEHNPHFLNLQPKFSKYAAKTLLNKLATKKLIMHNAVFDVCMTKSNFDIDLSDALYCDTILLKHAVDENPPFGLKELAEQYKREILLSDTEAANQEQLDLKESVKANGGTITKGNFEIYKADTQILGKYCAADCDLTLRLFNHLEPKLYEEKLDQLFYVDEVMPLCKEVVITMKYNGVAIDVPHFENLKKEIGSELVRLEQEIFDEITPYVGDYVVNMIKTEYPVSNKGSFAQKVVQLGGLSLPKSTNGKFSITQKNLKVFDQSNAHVRFLNGDLTALSESTLYGISTDLYMEEKGKLFNISSNDHLGYLFFTALKLKPLSKTATGKPQVDDDFLESIKEKHSFVHKLIEYKKLMKLQSTYVEGVLEKTYEGRIYADMLQFGTTSGRFSSKNINMQNLPRPKGEDSDLTPLVLKYTNEIRKGFIAGKGNKFVDMDYSALEPRCFACAADDTNLKNIFIKNEDMYSSIAIRTFNVKNASPFKKDENFLGKIHPEKRQATKAFCFVEDTKVETSEGIKNIQDLVVGDQVLTAHGFKNVTHTMKRKSLTGKFLTTKGGVVCTPDHKIWNKTKNMFMEAKDFQYGDEIEFTQFSHKENGYQKLPIYPTAAWKNSATKNFAELTFNEDWAYILGAFLGDGVGSYTVRKQQSNRGKNTHLISSYVGICGLSQDAVVSKWVNLVSNYGWNTCKRVDNRKNKNFVTNMVHHTEFTKLFQDTFASFIPGKGDSSGSKNLKIQKFVFDSPLQVKLSFIAGLLDTDGYLKRNKTKSYSDVAFCSKSVNLANDLVTLLGTLGVDCSMSPSFNKTYNKNYYIVRINRSGIFRLNQLGLSKYLICPRKKEAVELSTQAIIRNKPNYFQEFELAEEATVYDITVDEVHEFYANGIRVHNCLAVVYGAEAGRIAELLKIERNEAQKIIDDYFNSFPGLKNYIKECHVEAKLYGKVTNKYGRVRHLPEVQRIYKSYKDKLLDWKTANKHGLTDLRRSYKNGLNNSTNFPIQSLAATIINRAMIAMTRKFKELKLDAYICATTHDQCIITSTEKQVDKIFEIVVYEAENTIKLEVPLPVEAKIADNFKDSH